MTAVFFVYLDHIFTLVPHSHTLISFDYVSIFPHFQHILKSKISRPSIKSSPILPIVFFLHIRSSPIGPKILLAPLRHKDLVNYRTKQNCRRCFLCIFFKCFIHIEIVSLLRMSRKIDLLCFTSSNLSLNRTND